MGKKVQPVNDFMANMKNSIYITKASGELVPFSPEKLRLSLERAGASGSLITEIENEVLSHLTHGMTTKEIYKRAFSLLRKASGHTAAKYKLKKAIMQLGPSGYPFEKFIGAILDHKGYHTITGQIVEGHCVKHEVDVIAEKDNLHFMIECKFHSDQGRKCDVKIPLYIQSRFLDVEKAWMQKSGHSTKFHQGWLVTNTRFTTDAIQYGTCAGLNMVSWDFPKNGSLREMIDGSGLHPITCLTTLSKKEKRILLGQGLVLSRDICHDEKWQEMIRVTPAKVDDIVSEAMLLCEIQKI